jgi:ribosomal protein S27AE
MSPEALLKSGRGTPAERFAALCAVVTPERLAMLRAMPYGSFLRTGYWRIITAHVRESRQVCERCGSGSSLQVHHRTYEHHFAEHAHLGDLELLCRFCHADEHGIPTPNRWQPDGWMSAGEVLPYVMHKINWIHGQAVELAEAES